MHINELLEINSSDNNSIVECASSPRMRSPLSVLRSAASSSCLIIENDVSVGRDSPPRMRSPFTNKSIKSKMIINKLRLDRLKSSSGLRSSIRPQSGESMFSRTPRHTVRKFIESQVTECITTRNHTSTEIANSMHKKSRMEIEQK